MKNLETGWYMRVHPVFRILCFVVFSLSLVLAGAAQLLFAMLLLSLIYRSTGGQCFVAAMLTLRRLRWFMLSIVIVYGWLTPGPAIFGLEGMWGMPSTIGLVQGTQRLLILVMIVMAGHWLLWTIPKDRLVAALYWMAKPFAVLGVSAQSLAVRMALVFEMLPSVQLTIREHLVEQDVKKGDIKAYALVLVGVVMAVVSQAESDPLHEIEIDISDSPPLAQCVWPGALAMLMLLVGELNLPF